MSGERKMAMWRVWFDAARPRTLGAAFGPVLIGSGIAHHEGRFDPYSMLCALVGALLIQIGTNYANDYGDFVKGADTSERMGPRRATQSGLVSPSAMRAAAAIAFALACVPGAYIVYRGGWPFVAVGVISILCGVLYTAGPYPLAYVGLGELFVLIFFGLVATCGTYYLHTHTLTYPIILAGLGQGAIAVALLAINNLRDIDQDRAAGKRTLAVRFGVQFARIEFAACIAFAGLIVPLLLLSPEHSRGLVLVPVLTAALSARSIRAVLSGLSGSALNAELARTGQLSLAYGAIFALGWSL